MHLKYFGSAAAEGIPAMFCTCPVCETARRRGGKEIRTRSQAQVDGKLLIDFPPDTNYHALYGGLNLPAVTACILTHSHQDHLYGEDFENRKPGFAHNREVDRDYDQPLRVYATAKAMERVRLADTARLETGGVIELHEISAYEPFAVDDFTVTALTADHNQDFGPVIYIIERGGKTMLYANDTGYFPEETWDYLARVKPKFDFVSLDCTGMTEDYRRGHMGLAADAETRSRLEAIGCAGPGTIFCAHHFSHNGRLNHEELVREAEKIGFLVSYDGMEITF